MKAIKVLITPVVSYICLLLFGGIWNFKEYLKKSKNPNYLLLMAYQYYFHRYGAWIGYKSTVDRSTIFPHGYYGIFISNDAVIGKNCVIFQQVTIGSNSAEMNKKNSGLHSPVVSDDCYIGAGAKVIGGVKISRNCRIGANAVVYKDMPFNSVAVSSPTRIISKDKKMDNRFYSYQNNQWKVYTDGAFEEVVNYDSVDQEDGENT